MKGPIARGTLATSLVLGLRLLVQAGTLLLVAWLLGPDQFGGFAGVAALALVMGTLSPFGTHLVLLGAVAKDPGQRDRILSYAIPFTLGCASVLLIIFLGLSGSLLKGSLPFSVAFMIGCTEIVLQPLLALMSSEHHALGRVARAQLLQLLPLVLRLVVAAMVLLLQIPSALVVYATGYLFVSLLALAVGMRLLPSPWPPMRAWRLPSSSERVLAMGYAAINITKAGPSELDKTLALRVLPPVSAGLYAAATRVVGAATLPVAAMTLSALPRLFRDGYALPGTRRLLAWMLGSAFAYSTLLAAVLWLASPVFDLVFGSRYSGIGEMVRYLCAAVPGMCLRLVLGSALMALGRPWMRVTFELVGIVMLIVSGIVLTRHLGLVGMPMAMLISEWVMAGLGAIFLTAVMRVPTPSR